MATPKQLIDRLRENFDCALKDEKIVFMINSLEARLCTDILRPKDILKVKLEGAESKITLDFSAQRVLAVSVAGSQIRKSDANFPYGFRVLGNDIIFDFTVPKGTMVIEYLKMPKPFTSEDFDSRELLLGDEFIEVYVYHVLSREALICDDIERLNNYSTIYAAQLKALSESVFNTVGGSFSFTNLW